MNRDIAGSLYTDRLGRYITDVDMVIIIIIVTEDTRETVFLFQRLSIALQRGNAVAFLATFDAV